MQILYQNQFPNPIWRLIPSISSENTWAIETRDGQQKEVSYYFVDEQFNSKKLNAELVWWTGVECVNGSKIIFHGYLQEDLPIHQGIKVFDATLNQWLWENEFTTFVSITSHCICAKATMGSLPNNVYLHLDTGEEIAANDGCINIHESAQAIFLSSSDTHFQDIQSFIGRYTPLKPTSYFEYLETNTHIIVSYFVSNETKLDNYLLVTTTTGEEELHLCISQGLKGVAAGSFLVSKGLLSFVKDQKELFIIEML